MEHEHVTYLAPRVVAAIDDPGGAFEHVIGTWVAYSMRYARVYEVEEVDVGYDCSERVYPTELRLADLRLETVADFLGQATGATRATYVSGHGLLAETYEDELWDRVRDAFGDLVDTLLSTAPASVRASFEADEDPYGSLADHGATEEAQLAWQDAYASRPLAPILRHHEFAARRQRQLEEERVRLREARLRARADLASPLLARLDHLVPPFVEAKTAHMLWSACETLAREAESEDQWRAFIEEATERARLSSSLRQRFPERAVEIWARVHSGGAKS